MSEELNRQKKVWEFLEYMLESISIMKTCHREFEDEKDVASEIKYKIKDYMEESK